MKSPEPLRVTTFVAAASVAATSPAGQAGAEDVCPISLSDVQGMGGACRFSPAVQGGTRNSLLLAAFVGGKLQVR